MNNYLFLGIESTGGVVVGHEIRREQITSDTGTNSSSGAATTNVRAFDFEPTSCNRTRQHEQPSESSCAPRSTIPCRLRGWTVTSDLRRGSELRQLQATVFCAGPATTRLHRLVINVNQADHSFFQLTISAHFLFFRLFMTSPAPWPFLALFYPPSNLSPV